MTSERRPAPSPESIDLAAALAAAGIANCKELTCRQAEQIAAATGLSLRQVECLSLAQAVVPLRYARNLGTFTAAGQQRLLQSRVLVVGLGGLGGYVVDQLARAGVGRIAAVDPDAFAEHDLNRQALCTVANLGQKKVAAAEQRIRQINPAVEFSGCEAQFQQLADDAFCGLDLAFDCLDSSQARVALEQRCSAHGVPLVHAAIGGWCGQVGVSWPGTGMLKKIYCPEAQGIEQELGNPPFSPAVAAGLMVAKGIMILLGKGSAQEPALQWFDLLANDWETIRFPPGPY